jgi:hypothetical protein
MTLNFHKKPQRDFVFHFFLKFLLFLIYFIFFALYFFFQHADVHATACWRIGSYAPVYHIPYNITSSYLSSNQRPFTKIPGTTHKNYSVQDIILPTSHTPLEPTTWKCGGSRHPRQLQGLSCLGQLSSKFATVFILLTCTVHRCHPHGHPKVWECTMSIPGRRRRIVLLRDFSKGSLLRVILQEP